MTENKAGGCSAGAADEGFHLVRHVTPSRKSYTIYSCAVDNGNQGQFGREKRMNSSRGERVSSF